MVQETNYITLIGQNKEIGSAPVRYSMHGNSDNPIIFRDSNILLKDNRYSFLFVLQGELLFYFHNGTQICLVESQMMIVDKEQIDQLKFKGDTVILECVESDQMYPLTQKIAEVFNTPCSDSIFISSYIKDWSRNMFKDLLENPNRDNYYYYQRCRELTALLLDYPADILGTLYIPLYACSRTCDNCNKIFITK